MRKFLIVLLIIIIAAGITLYATKSFIFNKFKAFLIEKIESSTNIGLTIEDIGFVPLKGIRLTGLSIYKDRQYRKKMFGVACLYIKFPLKKLFINKILSPTITLDNLKLNNASIKGVLGFSISLVKKIEAPKDVLSAIENIRFRNLSIENLSFAVKNIRGVVDVKPESIKTEGLDFALNGEPCKLTFDITAPLKRLSSELKFTSSKLNFNARLKKENEVYKIDKLNGVFLNSSFDFIGEFQGVKNPILSLFGKVNLDMEDMAYLAPDESGKPIENLNLEGKVRASVYFKRNLKVESLYELGMKATADNLKVSNLKVNDFYMDMRVKDGKINIPLIKALSCNGGFISSAYIDLTDELVPYRANCKLSNFDIAEFIKNTELKNKNIKGLLYSEFAIRGDAKNMDSMEGSGKIFIDKANLGPMPLLTPLLGNLYGYLQGMLPSLKRVEITKGSCDFYIANRKVVTENLVLWGDMVSVHAKGYIDFDRNLDFDVENKFVEPEKPEEKDWQASLQAMIVQVGKMMSKARLTGTLKKPKWKFQYFGGVKDVFQGKLGKALKGIFE